MTSGYCQLKWITFKEVLRLTGATSLHGQQDIWSLLRRRETSRHIRDKSRLWTYQHT